MPKQHQVNSKALRNEGITITSWCSGDAQDGARKRLALRIMFAENMIPAVVFEIIKGGMTVYQKSNVPLEEAVEAYNKL